MALFAEETSSSLELESTLRSCGAKALIFSGIVF